MLAIIAEHDTKIRYAMSMLAQDHPGWMIARMVSSYSELVDVLGSTNPELLVVDLDMPGANDNNLEDIFPSSLKQIIYLISDPNFVHRHINNHNIKQTWIIKTEYPENLVKVFRAID